MCELPLHWKTCERHDVLHMTTARTTSTEAPRADWDLLTRRSVALCRKDPSRWEACMQLADDEEAAGIDPLIAVERALLAFDG